MKLWMGRAPITRTQVNLNSPLTQTETRFPWISPHFSVLFTRLTGTEITRIPH